MHKTLQSMSSAQKSVERLETDLHEDVFGPGLLKKRHCVEDGKYVVRDAVCLWVGKMSKEEDRAKQLCQLNARLVGC